MRIRHLFPFVLLGITIVGGCTNPYGKPLVKPTSPGFEGLLSYPQSRLITIHGMCHHDQTWVASTVSNLTTKYDVTGKLPEKPVWKSATDGVELYETTLKGENREVLVHAVVYSKLTLPLKQRYLCTDVAEDKPTESCPEGLASYQRERALVNSNIKGDLLNDCLSDAIIYLGPKGDEIREGVRQAFSQAVVRSQTSEQMRFAPLILLSQSLGSKVLADALMCQSPDDLQLLSRSLGSITHVFFEANQLPVLNLGARFDTCPGMKQRSGPRFLDRALSENFHRWIV